MKKRIMLFVLLVAMPIGSIFAQMAYNHWSIQAKGGVNTIRGLHRTIWDRDINAEFGGAIEYTYSPLIGVGVEYLYLKNDHSWKNFTSNVHQTTVFSSLNLSNLTLPYRTGFWKRLNTYFNVGIGLGYGDYSSTDTTLVDPTGSVLNLVGSLGLNFEYNLSPNFAIGIEPQFFTNTNSEYNPLPFQHNEKSFYTLNLNIRYKITGSRMHVRNQNFADYQFDQISNSERQRRKDAAIKAATEQLVIDHARSEAILIDSLYRETQKADSVLFQKIDSLKNIQATTIVKPIIVDKPVRKIRTVAPEVDQPVQKTPQVAPEVDQPVQKTPLVEPEVNQPVQKIPLVEPVTEETIDNTGISTKPVSIRQETYIDTPYCHTLLKEYSVVVGSFSNKENADKLASKLLSAGYEGLVIQNNKGMYRVISFTNSNVDLAISQVKKMRAKYPDAWIAKCVMK